MQQNTNTVSPFILNITQGIADDIFISAVITRMLCGVCEQFYELAGFFVGNLERHNNRYNTHPYILSYGLRGRQEIFRGRQDLILVHVEFV